ncbi:uncharacterized protein LOC120885587 [Ictidomys tridecemlineatus]
MASLLAVCPALLRHHHRLGLEMPGGHRVDAFFGIWGSRYWMNRLWHKRNLTAISGRDTWEPAGGTAQLATREPAANCSVGLDKDQGASCLSCDQGILDTSVWMSSFSEPVFHARPSAKKGRIRSPGFEGLGETLMAS